jgi:hypothetical protein
MPNPLLHIAFPYHRDDLPSFGVTPTVFSQGALDTERLARELADSDDRLDIDATELIDLADATARQITAQITP